MSERADEFFAPASPFRQELVDRVRREIEAGTYETQEKWEIALQKLFQRIEEER